MIHLVVDNGPDAQAKAWSAFDYAMLELTHMYENPQGASSEARRELATQTAEAWVRFRDLFERRPAATQGVAAPGAGS